MSKVRVILKPAGFIIAAFTAMILTIIVVFIAATQPEVFQKLLSKKATPAPDPAPVAATPAPGGATPASTLPTTAKVLTEWLVLSPIPSGEPPASSDTDKTALIGKIMDHTGIPGEAQLEPAANDRVDVDGKNLTWRTANATLLDMAPSKDPQVNVVGYAVTYVNQPKAVNNATLYLGSDDAVAVWLNGKEIWRNRVLRSCVAGSDKILNLPLKEGRNVLVFKIGQVDLDWCMTAALEVK